MYKKGFSPAVIVVILALVLLAGGVAWHYSNKSSSPQPVACTMEAKQCPDGSYVGRSGPSCEFAKCPPEISTSQTYVNSQYGFSITLPESWRGYKVLDKQWEVNSVETGYGTAGVTMPGPAIILRHPKWTVDSPREDMPIWVFTLHQWDLVQNGHISVSAAPIPPSLLGRNSKYVLALPARYNYDFKTGFEEVDRLVHTLKVCEFTACAGAIPVPTQGTFLPAYKNDQFGFELMLTDAWKGYRVETSPGEPSNVIFEIPYIDPTVEKPYPWFAPFYIQVMPLAMFNANQPTHGQVISKTAKYAFLLVKNELPASLKNVNFDIPKAISTFKLTDSVAGRICGGNTPVPNPCPAGYKCVVPFTGATDQPGKCAKE